MSFGQVIEFDGHDLSPYVLVTGINRRVMPERGIETVKVPGRDGAYLSSAALEPLEVTVTCCITRRTMEDVADARTALSAILRPGEPRRLILPDSPGTYLMAVYKGGSELSALSHNPDIELTFICPDPVSFGIHRTEVIEITPVANILTGGTYPSYPTITAKPGKSSYWEVQNIKTGEFVRVYGSFDGTQTVIVDCSKQRCTINGSDARVDIKSDYFALEGTLKVSTSSGTATVEWDERWL